MNGCLFFGESFGECRRMTYLPAENKASHFDFTVRGISKCANPSNHTKIWFHPKERTAPTLSTPRLTVLRPKRTLGGIQTFSGDIHSDVRVSTKMLTLSEMHTQWTIVAVGSERCVLCGVLGTVAVDGSVASGGGRRRMFPPRAMNRAGIRALAI